MNLIEKLRAKYGVVKAVIYARFSSDLQREESIDAQMRATKEFADRNGIVVLREYADRAKSATTDKRPEFQRMIADAHKREFQLVLVHKLDRFARNRIDSLGYKMELKKYGVSLFSVTEQLDFDSPESIITESVLDAMAEYYSLNLAREVEKGKKENAYKCKHTGGQPPLGYDVDPETKLLVINEHEAEAVRIIFHRYIEGYGYLQIANELNAKGYRTKKGNTFSTNSFVSILSNEKYMGTYVYNKSAEKSADGTRNGHAYKPEEEWIKIENGVPPIVSKDDFLYIQQKLATNKKKFHGHKHIEEYMLSGKIFCGKCGSPYIGDRRADKRRSNVLVKYVCNLKKRKGKNGCVARDLHRDVLEKIVLDKIAENVFDDTLLEKLTEYYNGFKEMCNDELNGKKTALEKKIKNLEGDMEYLITMMIKKRTESLFEKLEKMEKEKANLQNELKKLEQTQKTSPVSQSDIEYTLWHAQKMLKNKTLSNTKQLIESLVDRVIIYEDYIQIKFTFAKTKDYNFNPPTKEELVGDGQKNNLDVTDVTPRCGGEGGS